MTDAHSGDRYQNLTGARLFQGSGLNAEAGVRRACNGGSDLH
jgi:hypothetical protein